MTDIPGPAVTPACCAVARLMMATGVSLQDTAITLKVRSQALDRALWAHLGTPLTELLVEPRKRRYRADF